MDTQAQTIQFTLSEEEFFEYSTHFLTTKSGRAYCWRQFLRIQTILIVAYLVLGVLIHPMLAAILWTVSAVALFVRARGHPVFWAGDSVNRRVLKKAWKKNPALAPGRMEVRIDESGLSFRDDHQHVTFRWPSVDALKETANLFLVCIAGERVLLLPKRAFADGGCVEAFLRRIRSRVGPSRAESMQDKTAPA